MCHNRNYCHQHRVDTSNIPRRYLQNMNVKEYEKCGLKELHIWWLRDLLRPVCHEESLVVLYHILFDNVYEAYNFSSRMCGVEKHLRF